MKDSEGGFAESASAMEGLSGSTFDHGLIGKGKGGVLRLLEGKGR